ncbi:MAG: hypothetical protein ACLQF1_02910 [Methyloceanibacter sp.]|jgi:transcriptional regulator with XRE-family HTH domain
MKRTSIFFNKAIGIRLAALRSGHSLEVSEAAAKAGVTARSWRKWESGSPWVSPLPWIHVAPEG